MCVNLNSHDPPKRLVADDLVTGAPVIARAARWIISNRYSSRSAVLATTAVVEEIPRKRTLSTQLMTVWGPRFVSASGPNNRPYARLWAPSRRRAGILRESRMWFRS